MDLKNVEISEGVEYIGNECFSCSKVEEFTFPSTLKEIELDAF